MLKRTMVTRYVLIAAGFLSVGTGIVGIFIPLLPTTPFLLLAAACFARSSERFHTWLLQHRFLGSYIRNYREQRGMTRNAKTVVLVFLWGVMIHNFIILPEWWIRVGFALLGTTVTIHILRLRTVPSRKDAESETAQQSQGDPSRKTD